MKLIEIANTIDEKEKQRLLLEYVKTDIENFCPFSEGVLNGSGTYKFQDTTICDGSLVLRYDATAYYFEEITGDDIDEPISRETHVSDIDIEQIELRCLDTDTELFWYEKQNKSVLQPVVDIIADCYTLKTK